MFLSLWCCGSTCCQSSSIWPLTSSRFLGQRSSWLGAPRHLDWIGSGRAHPQLSTQGPQGGGGHKAPLSRWHHGTVRQLRSTTLTESRNVRTTFDWNTGWSRWLELEIVSNGWGGYEDIASQATVRAWLEILPMETAHPLHVSLVIATRACLNFYGAFRVSCLDI
jgi:hypothetical protein